MVNDKVSKFNKYMQVCYNVLALVDAGKLWTGLGIQQKKCLL